MTFSPLVTKTPRELFTYVQGYEDGYEYGLSEALEGWSAESASELANVTPPTDPVRSPVGPSPVGAPPTGSTDAAPRSSSTDRGSRPDSDVRVAGYDSALGTMLASREAPGPGWVSIGTISDREFDSLPAWETRDETHSHPTSWYLGLHSTEPTADEPTEVDGGSYKRVSVTNNAAVTFDAPKPSSSWGTLLYGDRYEVDSDGECQTTNDDDLYLGYTAAMTVAADMASKAGADELFMEFVRLAVAAARKLS